MNERTISSGPIKGIIKREEREFFVFDCCVGGWIALVDGIYRALRTRFISSDIGTNGPASSSVVVVFLDTTTRDSYGKKQFNHELPLSPPNLDRARNQ
jgi:hypothetical protein